MTDIREDHDEIKTRGPGHAWFAVSYEIFDHPVVGSETPSPAPADPSRHAWHPFMAWLWLIREAARHERMVTIGSYRIPLDRGQVAVSQRYLARRFNWGHKAVRRFIDRLARHDMVGPSVSQACPEKGTARGTGRGTGITVLTIRKYDVYQRPMEDGGTGKGTARGTRGAQQGHSRGTKAYRDTEIEKDDSARATFIDGKIELHSDLHTFWLGQFGGDEKALQLALIQAAGFIQPNGLHNLETKVSSQLAKLCRDERNRDKSYQRAAASKPKPNSSGELPAWRREIKEKTARMLAAAEKMRPGE